MSEHVGTSSGTLRHIVWNIVWNTLERIGTSLGTLWNVLEHQLDYNTLEHRLEYIGACWNIVWNILECVGTLAGTCGNTLEHAGRVGTLVGIRWNMGCPGPPSYLFAFGLGLHFLRIVQSSPGIRLTQMPLFFCSLSRVVCPETRFSKVSP
jgi:hypothetical protein